MEFGMIKVGTVCSGIGAPEKALRNLGIDYELAYFCEFDKFATKSYCAIHGESESKNLGDLTRVDIDSLPCDLDLLVGGTPCQDFSHAGLRGGGEADSGTRSSLMWNFVAIIERTQPKAVLWENVVGCLTDKMRPNYDKFLNALRSAGYKIHANILNSKDFGVPQNRERVFVLAIRKDIATEFENPVGYDCGIRLKDVLEKHVDEKYFLSDKQIESFTNSVKKKKSRGCGFDFKPTDGSGNAKTITTREACVADCNWIKEPNQLIELTKDQPQGNRVYDEQNGRVRQDGCVGTITTDGSTPKHNNRIIENYRIRKLTPRECFRLMGFADDDFNACESVEMSNAQLYKQAGNSIVVNVLMAIFGQLYGVEWKKKVYGDWYKSEQDLLAELPLLKGEIE